MTATLHAWAGPLEWTSRYGGSKRLADARPHLWPCPHRPPHPHSAPMGQGDSRGDVLERHCPGTGPEENGQKEPRPAGPGLAHPRRVRAQLGSWSHVGPNNQGAPLPPRRHTLHFPIFSIYEPFSHTCPHSVQTNTCLRWGSDRQACFTNKDKADVRHQAMSSGGLTTELHDRRYPTQPPKTRRIEAVVQG